MSVQARLRIVCNTLDGYYSGVIPCDTDHVLQLQSERRALMLAMIRQFKTSIRS